MFDAIDSTQLFSCTSTCCKFKQWIDQRLYGNLRGEVFAKIEKVHPSRSANEIGNAQILQRHTHHDPGASAK